jgi:hypothetical protein
MYKNTFFFEFLIKSIEILRFCLKFNKEILKIIFPSNLIYFESKFLCFDFIKDYEEGYNNDYHKN